MADKYDVFDQLGELENTLNTTLTQISGIRQVLEASMTENATLRMELEKLRDRLAEFEKKEVKKETLKDQPNPNLIQIFNEGFHVCHLHYAERLAEGESCLDCLELLYR
ncbi:DNA replication initiation control protein YabA [Lactococcus cremoris]|uniref:DNA replication initiation control protein YabA n=1 Tax=Lactococcus lactis subsp. cremoris TaxID=1359 RepID=UPI001C26528D|nr:DNA replication initiation control protein YabA [Lactococcus cremoris]MBU8903173.1 DNA replication initiation control protein YabA [Lactococcus cremoris]MCT0486940.1 DNA replication initiation control protein YabA [Lactococcus cremoris]MCT4455409.1 DNA replication initiation control protein YabA [Lactococcus cremoris]